ncbi:hypothetical protein AYO41_03050 [Verrucomicrobia bacterium SCGC AG-212-E04]|nr:hypothetical protein AYO41_03050 [Verrucomicrobia bacterium SCGC AG-212-E04]
MDAHLLRSHNPYLPPLASVAPELQDYVNAVIEVVPVLADSLMEFARYFAGVLVNQYSKRTSEQNAQFLVLCIFDVQIYQLSRHFRESLQDEAIAANLAGAVLFQALGRTPQCDDQNIFLGLSYRLRGSDKYAAAARIFSYTTEPVGTTFGREFAQLLYGRTTEDVVMLGTSKLLAVGLYTDANIRGILFGEEFGDEARARVEATCADQDRKTTQAIQEWRRRNPTAGY